VSDDQITVKSELWTGELPTGPKPRKKMTKGQATFGLLLSGFALCDIPWNIFDGFRTGLIRMPFDKWHHTVPIGHKMAFGICVAVWLLGWLLVGLFALGCALRLSGKIKPKC
jgi:hypothetical protein